MWKMSMATTPRAAPFGALLFAGHLGECCSAASDLGYQGIEINLRDREELDPTQLRTLLAKHGLTLSILASGRAFLEDNISFSDADEAVRRRAVERIKNHIDFAAEFGAPVLIGTMRGAALADGNMQRAMDRIADCLQECAKYATTSGTNLYVEAINRYETVFLNRCEEVLSLIQRIECPNVSVMLDTFHMNIEEVSIADAIRQAGKRLGHLHLADTNRWAPGWGHLDFDEVVAALREIDYQGWISAEILPLPDDLAAARQAVHFARGIGAVG